MADEASENATKSKLLSLRPINLSNWIIGVAFAGLKLAAIILSGVHLGQYPSQSFYQFTMIGKTI